MESISRMIDCGGPSSGGAMYACPQCGNLKFVPFRCKSRFRPTCGVKYAQEHSSQMAFKLIRYSFQTALLGLLESRIGLSFKTARALIYRKDKNGFYVYAKSNLCDTDAVIKYISRYLGRPVIALNRIDSCDGNNVTFHYNRHEDNAFVKKTIPALDFIKLPIQHIPDKNFSCLYHKGFYVNLF